MTSGRVFEIGIIGGKGGPNPVAHWIVDPQLFAQGPLVLWGFPF